MSPFHLSRFRQQLSLNLVGRDLSSAIVVFLVALPLCLGIALASGAPLLSGVVAGVVGGIVVGSLSGSHTSVSGPAAGLTTIVLAQIAILGSFDAFLLALAFAGVLQIGLGLMRAGTLASFVPTSVIQGLLAAIGIILVLKQIPHVLGHNADPEGELEFSRPDHGHTFSELLRVMEDLHMGAALIGLLSLALLIVWPRLSFLRRFPVPAPCVVVLVGLALAAMFELIGGEWAIGVSHVVEVPIASDVGGILGLIRPPDLTVWANPSLYVAAVTIAVVASLETLLNLEAADQLDPRRRSSPRSRELMAQGVGNITCGLLGGIPVTSVVIRSSVNISSGAASKLSAIMHGLLLMGSVLAFPQFLNRIPLSCLAAILLVSGFKLASPNIVRKVYAAGYDQFLPFSATTVAIVLTDPLIGVGIGLAVSLGFIVARQARRPIRRISEKHVGNNVLRVILPEQMTFLNQVTLQHLLAEVPRGSHLLLDAQGTQYVDPDVLAFLRDYRDLTAPARGVHLSMTGFHESYRLDDRIQFVDYSTRDLQSSVTPAQVLEILLEGNARFRQGRMLNRDFTQGVDATALGQHPLAVVLSCIDSRTPAEFVFDMGLGDIFSVRVAGNALSPKVLGSMEFGCAVAGARLIVVMGHTRCCAVTTAVDLAAASPSALQTTGCAHLDRILVDIQATTQPEACKHAATLSSDEKSAFVDSVARDNVASVAKRIVQESQALRTLVEEGKIAIVGVLHDVKTGALKVL